ncbi:Camphor resistance CrcB protein [Thiobacillus denitrificans ATCC 25259]|uniref:Fluoride-specific ion channel FluC n=1 Tax=Thiobacillus denitrificans (strain ATCC 25259 / T1) TaxID=292415 RepID=FLUC_THIDA|nr:fluoride efflux transporter CrcB [Thiobacillus denitrificans]Q3SK07.1 RecName: Full=Fluoride-specific ion channel FluC [Thiobacillus denitrificans ATCC 25259]AAZ96989.1 Camphor resistance CrcB protein [Thiobacillus denitrificans ATCC 25259]
MTAFLAVGFGAAVGAWLRWGLGLWLNPAYPAMPLGTLAANVIGGYFIGLVLAWFAEHPGVPPEARLFVITGLLGGLTTFSTFSAEVVTALTRGLWLTGSLIAFAHLAGSFIATGLGFYSLKFLK